MPPSRPPPPEPATLVRDREKGGDRRLPSFALVVTSGPDLGAHYLVDGTQASRALVGQSAACQFRLVDRSVSRRHAALEIAREGLRLTDLESTNGTFANGLLVREVILRGSEVVTMGDTTLRVDRLAAASAAPETNELRFGRLIGGSDEMRRLYPLAARLAASDVPVVIEGETGTGKEVLAEALHEASPRASAPFVVFDCTRIAPTVIESALFGHEKGAFTGALATRKGVFEQAHGGTLFIDEIGDLELSLQAKLLRAIERKEVQRVGGDTWLKVDVRVISATRRDLDREVQEGRFRDDLFYRLAVARVELPPLRKRQGDVERLARHFWRELEASEAFPPDLLPRLESYAWPGNVRELHNTIARRIALGSLDQIGIGRASFSPRAPAVSEGAPDAIDHVLGLNLPLPRARELVVEEFERRYVERVYEEYGQNVGRAAAASGIKRRYFQLLRARTKK